MHVNIYVLCMCVCVHVPVDNICLLSSLGLADATSQTQVASVEKKVCCNTRNSHQVEMLCLEWPWLSALGPKCQSDVWNPGCLFVHNDSFVFPFSCFFLCIITSNLPAYNVEKVHFFLCVVS